MAFRTKVGKYQIDRTIGEGSFSKVKLAVNTMTGEYVAIKVIDKKMVMQNKLVHQVEREISTMKLLRHPNIVRINEVTATKTRIFIVMEYVSGGRLSDKMFYFKRLREEETRKYFQQLIDAVDYCHQRGVCHRDLKPENLLLDGKGNLKVSDFGLCALQKPGDLVSTKCGSPCYVAPEVFTSKNYDGVVADIWSCGVILFELLAGYLPFNDSNLMQLYRKISRAQYKCPAVSQRTLLSRILEPNPAKRITLAELFKDKWFQTNYKPSEGTEWDELHQHTNSDDANGVFDALEVNKIELEANICKSPSFINAFHLIAMSRELNLSGLFEEQITRLVSGHPIHETFEKIEVAGEDLSLQVTRMNSSKVKIHQKEKLNRSCFNLSAEVIEVTPAYCIVEVSNNVGELAVYEKFCKSLSTLLAEKSVLPTAMFTPFCITTKGYTASSIEEAGNLYEN